MRTFVILVLTACKGSSPTDTDPDSPLPVSPLTCAEVDRGADAQDLAFDSETTLEGVYRIDGRAIYDAGQVVTVQPGTVFLMGPDSSLLFGWRSDPATVFMNGTEEQPILFCGTAAGPLHWQGLELLSGTTTDSGLSHVRVEDAGRGEHPALLLQPELDLVSLQLIGNGAVGLHAEQLGAGSADFEINGNSIAAHLLSGAAISALPAGSYTGNIDDVVLVSGHGNADAVFHDRGVPYRQLDDRVVYGQAGGPSVSLTLEAGVVYEFCQDCDLRIGWRGDPATLTAVGTPDAPVVFTSASPTPAPGDWNGLHLMTGTNSDSVLTQVHFEFGGKNSHDPTEAANLMVDGGLATLTDCSFNDSLGWGLWLEDVQSGFSHTGSTFSGNGLGDVFTQTP